MSTLRLVSKPILIAIVLALAVRSAVHIYAIPSASMEPTLQPGDHMVVSGYRHDSPERGDVVVFRSPDNPEELFVKRIVAAPGDLIESRAGRLFVAGHAVAEPYLLAQATTSSIPPQVIPAGCYFVLGDNRANSSDSREWGALPRALLVGHARIVLWSSGTGAMEPRANAASISAGVLRSPALRLERLFKPIR
jgi:signal peptidase I